MHTPCRIQHSMLASGSVYDARRPDRPRLADKSLMKRLERGYVGGNEVARKLVQQTEASIRFVRGTGIGRKSSKGLTRAQRGFRPHCWWLNLSLKMSEDDLDLSRSC